MQRLGPVALQPHIVADERRRLGLQPGELTQELRPLRRILHRPHVGLHCRTSACGVLEIFLP